MATTKKTPKISEYETYKQSPYHIILQSKQYAPKPEEELFNDSKGTLYAAYKVPKNKTIVTDPKPYTKVYDGNELLLASLTEPATKMLFYICGNLRPNSDEVCIILAEYLNFFGYNANGRITYYRALEGLLKANIIARKVGTTSCFYINPDIIYNGDRTKLKNSTVRPPDSPFSGYDEKERVFNMPPNNDI